jgi:hypothetical protein
LAATASGGYIEEDLRNVPEVRSNEEAMNRKQRRAAKAQGRGETKFFVFNPDEGWFGFRARNGEW